MALGVAAPEAESIDMSDDMSDDMSSRQNRQHIWLRKSTREQSWPPKAKPRTTSASIYRFDVLVRGLLMLRDRSTQDWNG